MGGQEGEVGATRNKITLNGLPLALILRHEGVEIQSGGASVRRIVKPPLREGDANGKISCCSAQSHVGSGGGREGEGSRYTARGDASTPRIRMQIYRAPHVIHT